MRPKTEQPKPDRSGQAARTLTTPTGTIERFLITTAISVAIILASLASAYGAAAGQITGTVVDSAGGHPVVGASVILVGTTRGAMSDFDGRFIIRQIEPGSCTIRISHLDYVTMDITDVAVRPDLTTDLGTIKLPLKGDSSREKTTVIGERDILQRFDASNVVTLPRTEVDRKSPKTIDELLRETAGVITNSKGEVCIRGGPGGEISYIIDGQSIGDPLGALGPAGKTRGEIPMRPRYPAGPFDHDEQRFDDMYFHDYGVNPWTDTRRDSRSTFAADVDDASFIITRAFLERGHLPPPDAVRTEEFINHFDYDYDGSFRETFRVFVEGAPSPFAPDVDLLRIGIKGREIPRQQRADANLVFVIDRSGSMQRERRLELVKDALHMLLTQLRPADRIAIVAFDTRAEIILRPTAANRKAEIQRAIDMVFANGSTNVEHGLKLGFELADQMFTRGKINHVMLLSDGVANTGRVQPEQLPKMIRRYAERGITLTTVGVGMGNYNDVLLEKLGNKGNGGYAYVDSRDEAYRIFVEKLTGTLQVIARDVKIQVTFNPEIIASYRLLGYENRDVPDHKFRDDRHDGGEVGAGHEVTAVYQVQYHRHSRSDDLGTVAIRYKDPERTERVHEITGDISRRHLQRHFDRASGNFQLAIVAAEFAEVLRQVNAWPGHASLTDLERRAARLARHTESPQLDQLVDMIRQALRHEDHLADR